MSHCWGASGAGSAPLVGLSVTRRVAAPGTQHTSASFPLWTSGRGVLPRAHPPGSGAPRQSQCGGCCVRTRGLKGKGPESGVGLSQVHAQPPFQHSHRAAPDVESGNVTECHDSHCHISEIKRRLPMGVAGSQGPQFKWRCFLIWGVSLRGCGACVGASREGCVRREARQQ